MYVRDRRDPMAKGSLGRAASGGKEYHYCFCSAKLKEGCNSWRRTDTKDINRCPKAAIEWVGSMRLPVADSQGLHEMASGAEMWGMFAFRKSSTAYVPSSSSELESSRSIVVGNDVALLNGPSLRG
jgi:hypothetical protein